MAQDNFLKVALGSDRYVIDAPFGDLPADLGKVTDIAAGRDGTVFLLTRHDCRSEEARDCVHMLTARARIWAAGGEITSSMRTSLRSTARGGSGSWTAMRTRSSLSTGPGVF